MHLVILPGLDGTALQLDEFVDLARAQYTAVTVIEYPQDEFLEYSKLFIFVQARLPAKEKFFLLAESFSGPIAIAIAAAHPRNLQALVLVASFARYHSIFKYPARFAKRWYSPSWLPFFFIRYLLFGSNKKHTQTQKLRHTMRLINPRIFQFRAKQALYVDMRASLSEVQVPVLYLCAKQDWIVAAKAAREIQAFLPAMKIIELNGPHFLLQSLPNQCLRILLDNEFLTQ